MASAQVPPAHRPASRGAHRCGRVPRRAPAARLADKFGVDVETMRQDLVTYLDLESWGWSFDIFRRPVIEFVQPERGYTTDGSGSTLVRVVSDGSPGLGVEHLNAGDLAVIYTAGPALLDVDPDDNDLAEALAVIAETMYGEPASAPRGGDWNRFLAPPAGRTGAAPQGQDRLLADVA